MMSIWRRVANWQQQHETWQGQRKSICTIYITLVHPFFFPTVIHRGGQVYTSHGLCGKSHESWVTTLSSVTRKGGKGLGLYMKQTKTPLTCLPAFITGSRFSTRLYFPVHTTLSPAVKKGCRGSLGKSLASCCARYGVCLYSFLL